MPTLNLDYSRRSMSVQGFFDLELTRSKCRDWLELLLNIKTQRDSNLPSYFCADANLQ